MAFQADEDTVQRALDRVHHASWYDRDAAPVYDGLLYYPGLHRAMNDKSQTNSVEADNAELRHYLARLVRKSRCFSRYIDALHDAVKLFVFCRNSRHLYKHSYPNYPSHLFAFCT